LIASIEIFDKSESSSLYKVVLPTCFKLKAVESLSHVISCSVEKLWQCTSCHRFQQQN